MNVTHRDQTKSHFQLFLENFWLYFKQFSYCRQLLKKLFLQIQGALDVWSKLKNLISDPYLLQVTFPRPACYPNNI